MDKVYKKRKSKPESKLAMEQDLIRAVKTLGKASIFTASEDDIQDLIDTNSKNFTQQRRNVMRLRQLLKYLGRTDVDIRMENEEYKMVKYLTLKELGELREEFKNDRIMWCLITIAALAALRMSEIYGILPHQIKSPTTLWVDTQLQPDGTRCLPKNYKKRNAYMLNGAKEAIEEWVNIPLADKEDYRKGKNKIPNLVKAACKKLWANNEDKHLNFRDLRHIFAVHAFSKGTPLELVASSMGHSESVCKKYYQGFMITHEGISTMDRFLKS